MVIKCNFWTNDVLHVVFLMNIISLPVESTSCHPQKARFTVEQMKKIEEKIERDAWKQKVNTKEGSSTGSI